MSKKIAKALVVGAGISGIRAALDLAEAGYGVTLIDRAPHIGGLLSQIDYQFPTNRCGMCKMLPLVDRDASSQYCLRKGFFHENIEILLSTELEGIEGEPGHFEVSLREKQRLVNPDLCIGCGICSEVCPVEIPDNFNAGLTKRKAIYLPVPVSIPNPYVIDTAACTRCGACVKACPTQAIFLADENRKKFKILVVDDEPIVRLSLKESIEQKGFSVNMASSGQEALEKLLEQRFHLMLLDIIMPDMNGVEVLKKSLDIDPELSVIMMTAYATVESAVEALKTGAFDYLVKPFNNNVLISMVNKIYEVLEKSNHKKLEVGAIVLAGGTSFFDPSNGKNTLGYKIFPDVVTSMEFERILSSTGPSKGKLVRPSDGKQVKKIAWIQCVGSRSLQTDSDFCSSVCCMYSIKEAILAKEKSPGPIDCVIFYMDLRSYEKSFQRYCDRAKAAGVRLERCRAHSVIRNEDTGDLLVDHLSHNAKRKEETFDMVVLAVGQRPSPSTEKLAEITGIELNPWGFSKTDNLFPARSGKNGIFIAGSYAGFKDIGESIIQSSAAAFEASSVIHAAGGDLAVKITGQESTFRDVSMESPRILIVICTCGESLSDAYDTVHLTTKLKEDLSVMQVSYLHQICTSQGWDELVKVVHRTKPNRILIGACLPYVYAEKLKELGKAVALAPQMMEVVDVRTPFFSNPGLAGADKSEFDQPESHDEKNEKNAKSIESILQMGVSRLKHAEPGQTPKVKVIQKALVIGGGIAGMTAALGIANHGFSVDLVEKSDTLCGNLQWLKKTINGDDMEVILNDICNQVEKHPKIEIHLNTRVVEAYGQVGQFNSTLKNDQGSLKFINHGTTILATGGNEAKTQEYGYGRNECILTQKDLEIKLSENTFNPQQLSTVVMIQCVGSRQEPRNYCSRICCASTLKNALRLKKINPVLNIFVLYRDIMSYGFLESYYTQARKKGIIFIPYETEKKPEIDFSETAEGKKGSAKITVTTFEPIIGQNLEIRTDLLILATGVIPDLPVNLAEAYGASVDQDGFFLEADSKWRPVDSLTEGVFACGLALGPRSVAESIATAQAAVQRSIRLLRREWLPTGKRVAVVRHSLCSLCETCITACPYGARTVDFDHGKIIVNPARCQGCGACAAVCPNSASVLSGHNDRQMLDVIDAAIYG